MQGDQHASEALLDADVLFYVAWLRHAKTIKTPFWIFFGSFWPPAASEARVWDFRHLFHFVEPGGSEFADGERLGALWQLRNLSTGPHLRCSDSALLGHGSATAALH